MSRCTYRHVDIHRTIMVARSSGTQLSPTAGMNLPARETVANTTHSSPGSYFLAHERSSVDLEPFCGNCREHCDQVDPNRGRFGWPEYPNDLFGETNLRLDYCDAESIKLWKDDDLAWFRWPGEKKSDSLPRPAGYHLGHPVDCNRIRRFDIPSGDKLGNPKANRVY